MMSRLLVTGVFWNGFHGQSIVSFGEDGLTVVPFEKEIHSTVFIPGYIAILDASRLDEFVIDDIELMITHDGSINDKKRLDDYLKSSSLYYNNGDCRPAILKLGKPCQIIPIS